MVIILDPILPPPDPDALPVPPCQQSARWYISAQPTARVVTAAQVRKHCRIDDATEDDDAFVNLFIDAAQEYAESRLAASLMPRTIVATFNAFESIDLPRGPVISVTSVTDAKSAAVTGFTLQGIGYTTRIVPPGGPLYPVTVTYRAGHVATDGVTPAVPGDIVLAILMHAATLYTNRESISDKAMLPVPHALDAFYDRKSRQTGVA